METRTDFNIELPFFPGLYESVLYSSDDSYYAIKDELEYYQNEYCEYGQGDPSEKEIYAQLTEDDLDFDFQGYAKEICDYWVDAFKSNMPDIVVSLENVEMTSPKYYNFSTDRLWADIKLCDDWQEKVRAFMDENKDWLKERVKKDWTSYDGFASFMSNNFDNTAHDEDEDWWGDKSWYFHLFSGKSDRWECYISTIIGYMMYHENKNIREDLAVFAREDVYVGQFVYITDEGKEKLQSLRDQREEDIREGRIVLPDPDQLKLPFEEQ